MSQGWYVSLETGCKTISVNYGAFSLYVKIFHAGHGSMKLGFGWKAPCWIICGQSHIPQSFVQNAHQYAGYKNILAGIIWRLNYIDTCYFKHEVPGMPADLDGTSRCSILLLNGRCCKYHVNYLSISLLEMLCKLHMTM